MQKEPVDMINMKYRKLTGMHAGHDYVVTAPASEMDSPMRWTLQCEAVRDERLVVSEAELGDKTLWKALD
jgi:hypothetical protein